MFPIPRFSLSTKCAFYAQSDYQDYTTVAYVFDDYQYANNAHALQVEEYSDRVEQVGDIGDKYYQYVVEMVIRPE